MRYIKYIFKGVVLVLLLLLTAVVVTSVTLVYDFQEPTPFSGENIYNPYRCFDKSISWKRANFHTHTRVDGLLNECEYSPEQTIEAYEPYGYHIITLSNHNKITPHPAADTKVYEHGYNIAKFHKLVFGADKVWGFDNLLPIFASQKQMQIDILSKQSDIVVVNHPLRTHTMTHNQLAKIGGYRIIELDSGKSTENEYWDAALSAGRYSFGIANDDLHHPERSRAIAVRSNMLNTSGDSHSEICRVLNEGNFYAMRTPDYGDGNWEVKAVKNHAIPYIYNIGITDRDEIFVKFSEAADSIKITGQGHTTLAKIVDADSLGYAMLPTDSYGRFTAYFSGGEVIYTNPFARYDASVAEEPFSKTYSVNVALTILHNAIIVALAALLALLIFKTVKL